MGNRARTGVLVFFCSLGRTETYPPKMGKGDVLNVEEKKIWLGVRGGIGGKGKL